MKLRSAWMIAFCFLMTTSIASADHNHPAPVMPKQFEVLKSLVGSWEGTTKMGDKEEEVKVTYSLTSNGTAVVEKMNPETPHEMISVYHKDGKSLAMTHYCSLGNQPHMKLKKADAKMISFEMKGARGIASLKEPHMHAVTLTLIDGDTLKQEWVHFEKGKKKEVVSFTLKRD